MLYAITVKGVPVKRADPFIEVAIRSIGLEPVGTVATEAHHEEPTQVTYAVFAVGKDERLPPGKAKRIIVDLRSMISRDASVGSYAVMVAKVDPQGALAVDKHDEAEQGYL